MRVHRFAHAFPALAVLLLTSAGPAGGCSVDADVVAFPLLSDAGSKAADGGALDGGGDAAVGRCDPSERVKRARLPDFALDLVLGCEANFSAFSPNLDGGSGLSPEELTFVFTAPMLRSDAGQTGTALCTAGGNVGWYFTPLAAPDSVHLCRETCELFREQVAFILSRDGCDGPADAGPSPGFDGSAGGAIRDDDAGHR